MVKATENYKVLFQFGDFFKINITSIAKVMPVLINTG